MPAMALRSHDVLLWGATGFTGALVAEELVRRYGVGRELRWALGGRSREKLEAVRSDLAKIDPRASELPILTGDASDRESLDRIALSSSVVCSTVGPYAVHGRELVAACVEAGTDYCDLTGEPQFVRAMIDAHHARARDTGARIVHCCGFDSIPSDLGTLLVQSAASAGNGSGCRQVKCFVVKIAGAMSGGTAASMVQVMEDATRDPAVRRLLMDPYALDPDRGEPGPDGPDPMGVAWDADLGSWTAPFIMASINMRVVRRTNALLGYAWGRDFGYRETMALGEGPKGWVMAAGVTTGTALGMAGAAIGPLRRFAAKRFLPASGEGPSKERRERGSFALRFVGVRRDGEDRLLATVRGHGDPGYAATATMLSESAVCLALDGDRIVKEGGVRTPASTMGLRLVERLRSTGMVFDVEGAPTT
jgi:short subunit dehydrogenase-like uncharacterized protein